MSALPIMTPQTGGAAPIHSTRMSASSSSRELMIPREVMDLPESISWPARLVLSEIINLYKPNSSVWVGDEYFVDRLKGLKLRTIQGAIKELVEAGLVERDTNQNRKPKRYLSPTLNTAIPAAKSAVATANLPQILREVTAKSAGGLTQNLREATADSAGINKNLIEKGNTNQTKTGEGENFSQNAKPVSSLSESKKVVTAPTPQPPAPAEDAEPAPVPDDPAAARALVPELAKRWHLSQQLNPMGWRKLTAFVLAIAAQGQLGYLRHQFAGFNAFFSDGLTPHNQDKFTGHEGQSPPYSGTWRSEGDWPAKAADRKPKPRPNGPTEAPARASASPSNQKSNWS